MRAVHAAGLVVALVAVLLAGEQPSARSSAFSSIDNRAIAGALAVQALWWVARYRQGSGVVRVGGAVFDASQL